jgi:hypothetical protein
MLQDHFAKNFATEQALNACGTPNEPHLILYLSEIYWHLIGCFSKMKQLCRIGFPVYYQTSAFSLV